MRLFPSRVNLFSAAMTILICLGWQFTAVAQKDAAGSSQLKQQIDAAVAELDRSKISSGILHDRVLSLGNISTFSGEGEITPVTLQQWRQLYYEMYQAAFDTPSWPSLNTLKTASDEKLNQRKIPFMIMNFQYHKIRENAIAGGLLSLRDGKLYDVPDASSPYQQGMLFAACAAKTHSYRRAVTFIIDEAFYFSNAIASSPETIEIDFDDGLGFQQIPMNSEVQVHYSSSGRKSITVKASADEELRTSKFQFQVREFNKNQQVANQPDLVWEDLVAENQYLGEAASYDLYTFLGAGNTQITKPLLFVEGFDIGDSLGLDELYALLNQQDLAPTLLTAGFDLTIMNFNDATDYIQRNSFALVSAIERIKTERAGSEPIIIAGASMGGLIGRYALAWMEDNGMDHETSLLLSFDSPQQSANLPLGIQFWGVFFADLDASAAALISELNAPGSQQMLAYHHLDEPNYGANALRATLFSELAALGNYPSDPDLRKVAIANGSGAGTTAGQTGNGEILMQPGTQIIEWEYSSILVDIIGNVWAVPDVSPNIQIMEGLIDVLIGADSQTDIFVDGTLPYDNAPGGWRPTQQQAADLDPGFGDILTNFPRHCFIPTVSALDLRDQNGDPLDLFYDAVNDPDLLSKSPFDTVYFPAGANEEHVEINEGNAGFMLEELGLDQLTFNQPIAGGWNMIGLPFEPPDPHYAILFPNAAENTLFTFEGTYVMTDSLTAGGGFWLSFPGAETVSVSGNLISSVTIDLRAGWNMIAPPSCDIALSDISDPGGIIDPGTLFGFDGIYVQTDTLRQGMGYWLNTISAGQITLDCNSSPSNLAKQNHETPDLSELPALTFQDAYGNKRTLYFNLPIHQGSRLASASFYLPPVPPAGIFDARLAGDRWATYAAEPEIRIQSPAFPMTVTAENLPDLPGGSYAMYDAGQNKYQFIASGIPITISNKAVRHLKLIVTENMLPAQFALEQNFPNPFNPATEIYNALGQKIRTLVSEQKEAGRYTVTWDATNDFGAQVASGIYLYRVTAGAHTAMKKMILMK